MTTTPVTWSDPPEPEQALDRLSGECIVAGWTPADPGTGAAGDADRVFEKDGVERTLRLTRESGRARLVLRERRLPSRAP